MNDPTLPTTVRAEAARTLLDRLWEKNALIRFFRYNASAKHGVPVDDRDVLQRVIVDSPVAEKLPAAEPPNLDYAREATDLVLERLKDQQHNPDPELLKRLDWTPEDLQQFLARWEQMKQAATTLARSL